MSALVLDLKEIKKLVILRLSEFSQIKEKNHPIEKLA